MLVFQCVYCGEKNISSEVKINKEQIHYYGCEACLSKHKFYACCLDCKKPVPYASLYVEPCKCKDCDCLSCSAFKHYIDVRNTRVLSGRHTDPNNNNRHFTS